MTKEQLREELHHIIQTAVQRAGGDWKRSFEEQVNAIEDTYKEYMIGGQQ